MNSSGASGLKNQSTEKTAEGMEKPPAWVVLAWKPAAISSRRSSSSLWKNSKRPSSPGRAGLHRAAPGCFPRTVRPHASRPRPSARAGRYCCAERKILLEAHLRHPEPQIAGAGERRNADLRQRTRFARIEDGLFHSDHDAAGLPIDLDGAGAQAHRLVSGAAAGIEIHVERAVHRAAQKVCGP